MPRTNGAKDKKKRIMNSNSLVNLKPQQWKKGQSGNPGGFSLKAALKWQLARPLEKVEKDAIAGDMIIAAEIRDAIKEDGKARDRIWERTEGRVAQPLTGEGGGAIPIRIIYERIEGTEGGPQDK